MTFALLQTQKRTCCDLLGAPSLRSALLFSTVRSSARSPPRPRRRERRLASRENPASAFSTSLIAHIQSERVEHAWQRRLPLTCPGCGAPSQTTLPEEAGFYSSKRSLVRSYLTKEASKDAEDRIWSNALQSAAGDMLERLGRETMPTSSPPVSAYEGPNLGASKQSSDNTMEPSTPICQRCHNLIHHNFGTSIYHPSVRSIEETIAASPHKHNHIYHVVDAADFPMSVIPNLPRHLNLPRMRTQNRRSRSQRYLRGRAVEVSFIITRSDLLAPKKEQVDSLMPYLVEVLRESLGSSTRNVRLGNVRCVSAKRGWWTKQLKEDIWHRGGAGWLVGKVNVGKSKLFEAVYPKGRVQGVGERRLRRDDTTQSIESGSATSPSQHDTSDIARRSDEVSGKDVFEETHLEPTSLLPPAQPEVQYPAMPVVSSIPGTTASPIRIPFGKGKGELIDLPGFARSNLEKYVRPEHRSGLIMESRVSPQRQVLKPGQSLLLGGLIRITPVTPNLVFMMHPFLPLAPHVTSTEKCSQIQEGHGGVTIPVITESSAADHMASAGRYQLRWDVTKKQAGPLTSRAAAGLKTDQLPFQVLAADILIEGCGWVEVVAQVRRRKGHGAGGGSSGDGDHSEERHVPDLPEIEVFSPEGKFIGARAPMNAFLLGGPLKRKTSARPRQSMKSVQARRQLKS